MWTRKREFTGRKSSQSYKDPGGGGVDQDSAGGGRCSGSDCDLHRQSCDISISISYMSLCMYLCCDASDNCISSPGNRHGDSVRIHLNLTSTLKSCEGAGTLSESRSAALTFASRSGAAAIAMTTTHLNGESLIGSGTLINWGLWRDSNQTSIIFVFDSSATDQRLVTLHRRAERFP